MSVMQLRDETDALQSEIERREKTGDLSGAKQCQQQLRTKQQQLLEKNRIRYDAFSLCQRNKEIFYIGIDGCIYFCCKYMHIRHLKAIFHVNPS